MPAQASWFRNHPHSHFTRLAGSTLYAFNAFLQFTAEEGVIGLILLIVLAVAICWRKGKPNNKVLRISEAGMLGIVVFGLFSYPAQILPIKVAFVCFLTVNASSSGHFMVFNVSDWTGNKSWQKGICAILFVGGLMLCGKYINHYYRTAKTWESAFHQYRAGNTKRSVMMYQSVYPFYQRKGDFLMNYGKALSRAKKDTEAVIILNEAAVYFNNVIIQTALGNSYKRMGKNKKAEQSYRLAAAMIPDRFYAPYLLAKLYAATGQNDKAISLCIKLLRKPVKVKSIAVRQIKEHLKKLLREQNF